MFEIDFPLHEIRYFLEDVVEGAVLELVYRVDDTLHLKFESMDEIEVEFPPMEWWQGYSNELECALGFFKIIELEIINELDRRKPKKLTAGESNVGTGKSDR